MRNACWIVGGLGAVLSSGCYQGADGHARGETESAGTDTAAEAGEDSGSMGGTDGATEGETEADPSSDSDDDNGPFACDPNAVPDSLSMRRLSRVQYRNTVRDLVVWAVGAGGEDVFAELDPVIDRAPQDVRRPAHDAPRGGFRRVDQDVQQEHINVSYDVATATAIRLTRDHLTAVAGSCATDADPANDEACISDFITRFGEHALRRPLSDDELTFYRDVFDAQGVTQGVEPEAFADVIVVMLTSPSFLYMVEHGDESAEEVGGVFRLTGHELAQRLSYQFWQAPPDDALREAAASGALEDDDTYAAQVDRLLDDPRAQDAVREFYGEWLWLEQLPAIDARVGTPVYDTFLDGFEVDPETTQNMIGEVLDMAAHYTLDEGGSFADFFMSDRSFASTPDLAEIYGVPVWDGGTPPAFPQPERVGLIARAAFLATGSANTRPIMKGVRIREALLCEELPPPPPNAAGTLPDLSPDLTTRQLVEMLTEQPGTNCAGCHTGLINPLGFVTENFDSLGRFRTEQILIDEDGNVTGSVPVATATVPRVVLSDDTPAQSAAEVSSLLLESEKIQACFSRNYLRWTFARDEDVEVDGCMLNAMTSNLLEGASLRDVLRQLALRDEFKTRKIEQ